MHNQWRIQTFRWGGGHPDPKIGVGGVVFFRSFRPQFGPTIRGARGARGAPGSVTDN